jgi:prefoldin subunit 5
MALAGFISKIVQSITRTTFQFNKTLDVLIDRFKGGCPTTKELESLVQQKNQINGALNQINQKIATLNKVAQGSEIAVEALKAGKTVIKQLPIPSSVPPGVGLPLSVTNNLADALDNLGTLIDKEEASLESIPEALELISNDVGEVITKLNEFDVVLNDCIEKDPNITSDN